MATNVEIYNIRADVAAADFVNAPKMGYTGQELDFPHAYDLVGLSLVSTMLNYGTAEMGVFIVVSNDQDQLTFSKTTAALLGHVSLQNSLPGPPAVPIPTNKSTPLPLPFPKRIPPRSKIRLYAFGGNDAGNRLLAYLSVQVVQVK